MVACLVSPAAAQTTCYRSGVGLRFKPVADGPPYSFLTPLTTHVNVTRSIPLPLVIVQALDSNSNVDRDVASVTIAVTSTTRLSNTRYSQPLLNGEAYFSNIVVEGSDPTYVLSFSSTSTFLESPLNGIELSVNVTNLLKLTSIYALRFAQNRSLFTTADVPYKVVLGVPLPPVVVNIVTSAYVTYPTSSLLGSNYSIQAFIGSNIVSLGNNHAVVLDGVATFPALTVLGSLGDGSPLPAIQFKLFNGAVAQEGVAVLATGLGTVMGFLVDYSHIGFLSEAQSAIFSEGQNFAATSGVPLQVNELPIRIQVLDNMYRPSPASSGLVVTAMCVTCPLSHSVQRNVAGVVNGVATFDNLKITMPSTSPPTPFVLTFTAGSQGGLKVAGDTLRTGIVMLYPNALHTCALSFFPNPNDSLFNFQGHALQVVLSLRMLPIRIQVTATNGQRNTTNDLTITASATNGVQFSGTLVQRVVSGIAEFNDLQFTSTRATVFPRITFTAGGSPQFLVFGQTIVTGVITIAPIESNYGLRFQPYGAGLFSLSGQPSFATTGVPMPPIIVELTTSAGSVDSSSNEIGITVSATGATLSGSFLRVSAGVAVFSSLTFQSEGPGSYILTFTAGSEGNTNVARKTLLTGAIRLVASVIENYAIRFRNDSFIRYPGHIVPVEVTTRTTVVQPVIIELVNSAHRSSRTAIAEVFVLAKTPLRTIKMSFVKAGDGNSVTYYERPGFPGLQFGTSFGPVATFTVQTDKASRTEPAVGQTIASGSLTLFTVTATVAMLHIVGNISINSDPNVYIIQQPGVNFSIPADSVMSVLLSIANSRGLSASVSATGLPINPLPPGTGISVSIQSNVPLADPQTVAVDPFTGLANFSSIRFTQAVPASVLPILTFTAATTAGSVPTILPITTGLITVIGPSAESGVDIVVQILFDYSTFDVTGWVASLALLLNIEPLRLVVKRAYFGSGADASTNRLNITANAVAVWYGTRLDIRVLEPLPTSRNTKAAWELVGQILAFKTDCSLPQLYLRRTFNLSDDATCDWFIYGDQATSATQCVLSGGEKAYCDCYTPLIQSMGMNCLGYTPLTDLCLNTLLQSANCKSKAITSVCNLLLPPSIPRFALLATGFVWGLVLAPLLVLKSNGYFHKLRRAEATGGRIEKLEGRVDETDLL